eukprot:CAMPEP_0181176732 /NCGR_PEP_ID=MMETSP1096-20121128/4785_1 /TAXON_ID=156174 ORGANISM="Chrysochromulina ericina, Strain CCMP281" /NCGR_SAMPLE_ID=MMETSP1096 /ASSEMBLY_ACC=CAM_ASM_000453 /LENGTH=168 /DNA_ID=CAMNT_0023264837 /DNA_START=95 /DNA_END=601 /DNA_ORIENTATION=-
MPIPRLTTSSCCSFEILCPEGSAAGDRVEVELPTVHAASAEVDTLERVRAFVEGDDQGFMQKIEAFCVQHVSAFGERDEIRQSSAEGREYPLEYQEIHMAFVALVEQLLEEFISELGLDAERFVALVARSGAADRERLLQAVDAMTDFDVFLAMVHDAAGPGGLSGTA